MQSFLKNLENHIVNYKNFFIKQKEFITIEELSKKIKIENLESLNLQDKIFDIKPLKEATENDISFLFNIKYIEDLENTNTGFCFIQKKFENKLSKNIKPIIVNNPHYCFTILLAELFTIPIFVINPIISDKAYLSKTAKIGKNVEIQQGVFIDDDVIIGDNCKICANVVINHNCIIGNGTFIGSNSTISYSIIGNNTIIQNNVAIGQCGFGFAHESGFNYKITQTGIVRIGNFVEIGAGTTISRGSFEDTIIQDIVKIDSLCQIAHGVKIGMGTFMAGQVGVSGSTEIGMFCQIGGQTGFAGHLKIADFNIIAGKSGIMKDTEKNEHLGGYPAKNMKDWHRETILLKKLLNKNDK